MRFIIIYNQYMRRVEKVRKESKMTEDFQEDWEKKMGDILYLLQQLYRMRLIDRIARPISSQKRKSIVKQYKKTFDSLHFKINKAKTEVPKQQDNQEGLKEKRSWRSTKATKPTLSKKMPKKVFSKYNEILIEGSFKHYQRVANLYQLDQMKVIDINGWLVSVVHGHLRHSESCC